jgi:hypothetical protein
MSKTVLKTIRGQLLPEKMRFENKFRPYVFFKFWCDYDLNLGRYLNPELPPMRDFASLYFLNRYTFVCGTLVPLKSNKAQSALDLSAETKFHIQKCNTCRYIEKPSSGIRYFTMVQYVDWPSVEKFKIWIV